VAAFIFPQKSGKLKNMTIENKLHTIINSPEHDTIKTAAQVALDEIHAAATETPLTEEQKHSIIRERIQHHRDRTARLILSGDITAAEQENSIALKLSCALPQGPSPETLREMVKNAIRDENLTGEPEDVDTLVSKYADTFGVSLKHLKTVAETEFAERKAHAATVALADFLDRYGVPSESVFGTGSVRHISPAASKNLDQVITLLDTAAPAVDKLTIRVEGDYLVAHMLKTSCAAEENQEPDLGAKVFEFDVPQELGSRRFTTNNVTNRHLSEILKDSAPLLVDLVIIRKLLSMSGSVDLDYSTLRQVRDQLDGHVAARWADYLKHNL
jgi:hypothetical protein